MNLKFAVIIVTYNRLELLKECLECIRQQKLEANSVVIIDNHSTDGTGEYLNSVPEIKDNKWILKTESQNIGGSGGFYDGMKLSMDTDSDWFLLIDDDAMIASDYLKLIAESIIRHPEILAFSGTVVTDNKIVVEHRRRFNKCEVVVDEKEYLNDEFEYDLSSFCGAVFNRRVIETVGFPERDFFLWYDDTEYSLRIMSVSKFVNVTAAVLNHKTKILGVSSKETKKKMNWKTYYGYRNIIYSHLKHHMVWLGIRCHVFCWLKDVIVDCLNPNINKEISQYNLKLVLTAILDGIRGNLGFNEKYKP